MYKSEYFIPKEGMQPNLKPATQVQLSVPRIVHFILVLL